MSKKSWALIVSIFLGLAYIYLKPSTKPRGQFANKQKLQTAVVKTTQTLLKEKPNRLEDLGDKQLLEKLEELKVDLESSQFKNYSDFSAKELQHYNQLVRESVQIKKLLFLRKYAHGRKI